MSNNPSKWIPTSKMTAVFMAGTIYAFGVTVIGLVYEVPLNPIDVAWNQLWFTFLAGYGATENRPSMTTLERLTEPLRD